MGAAIEPRRQPINIDRRSYREVLQASDFSDVPFRLNFMLFSEKNHVKALKNQWVLPRP